MVVRGARRDSDDPKMAQPPRKPALALASRHNRSLGHPGTIPCEAWLNSPKLAKIYFLDTHPHVWLPTRKSHKPAFAPMQFAARLDGGLAALELPATNWGHDRHPCRLPTYRLRLLRLVRLSIVASVASANRHRAIKSAMLAVAADVANQIAPLQLPLAKLAGGHSSLSRSPLHCLDRS